MKKLIAIIVSVLLMLSLFTACSNGEAKTSSKEDSSASQNEPKPIPKPEPEPEPLTPEPLTGLEKDDSYPNGKAPVAVMVNNIKIGQGRDAFPQWGISEADLIYEMVTEGGITRLMAVFQDYANMPSVGPVRSARDQHAQMMMPYNALYVHEGASQFAKRMLGAGVGADTYNPDDYSMYDYRDRDLYLGSQNLNTGSIVQWNHELMNSGRAQEMCAYTSGEAVSKAVENGANDSGEPEPIFNFVSYEEPARILPDGDAQSIFVQYSGTDLSGYHAQFDYDAAEGVYYKTDTRGMPHLDGNNDKQLKFDNVLVLFTDVVPYSSLGLDAGQLSFVDYSNGGMGYYFSKGTYQIVGWIKGLPDSPLRIMNIDGYDTDIQINTGKTYVGVTDYANYDLSQINGLSFNKELHPKEETPEVSSETTSEISSTAN